MRVTLLLLTLIVSVANAGVVSITYTDDFNNQQTYTSHQCITNDYNTPDIIFTTSFENNEIQHGSGYYYDIDCVSWPLPQQIGFLDDTVMVLNGVPNVCLTETFEYFNDVDFFLQVNCESDLNP